MQDPTDLRAWLVSHTTNYEGSSWAGQYGRKARAVFRFDTYTDSSYTPGHALGRRTEIWDASGHTRWTYDIRGRIIKEEKWIDGAYYKTEWTYDAMDRVVTMKYPDDEVVTYTYNAQLLLSGITSSSSGGETIASDLAYNALGLPTAVKLPNAVSDLYLRHRYHVLDSGSSTTPYGALWDIRLEKAGSNSLRLEHGYDYVRNVVRVIDSVSGDFGFEYDDLDRLLKRKITGGADQETFTYAAIGNIATKNGLSFSYSSSHKHAVSNYNGVAYAYDANGNMIGRGTTQTLKFDENRLVKVSSDSNGYVYIARMAYDGDGRRAKRVDNFGTIHYAGPHYERNVGTGADTTEVITKFYYAQMGAMKRLIAIRRAGTLYYVVPDHLGGTLRPVAANGDSVDDIRYHAFGATRSGGTNTPTDKRFTGQVLDASTGLYDFGARSLDAVLGRFLQPDSIVPNPGNPQSLNRYSYCWNNPFKFVDPTGHDPVSGDPDQDLYWRSRGYEPSDGEWAYTGKYTADVTSPEEAIAAAGDADYVLAMVGGVGTAGHEDRLSGLARATADEIGRNKVAAFNLKYNAGQPGDSDIAYIFAGSDYNQAVVRGYNLLVRVATALDAGGKFVFAAGHSRGADIVNGVADETNLLARTALFTKPYFSDPRGGRTQLRFKPIADIVGNGISGSPPMDALRIAGALIPAMSNWIGHGSTMNDDNYSNAATFFSSPMMCY